MPLAERSQPIVSRASLPGIAWNSVRLLRGPICMFSIQATKLCERQGGMGLRPLSPLVNVFLHTLQKDETAEEMSSWRLSLSS